MKDSPLFSNNQGTFSRKCDSFNQGSTYTPQYSIVLSHTANWAREKRWAICITLDAAAALCAAHRMAARCSCCWGCHKHLNTWVVFFFSVWPVSSRGIVIIMNESRKKGKHNQHPHGVAGSGPYSISQVPWRLVLIRERQKCAIIIFFQGNLIKLWRGVLNCKFSSR